MPSSNEIVQGLKQIAEAWTPLAIAWHVYFGLFATILVAGFRPSCRLTGALLVIPLLSVSGLAWAGGNPFNGIAFAAASFVLLVASNRLDSAKIRLSSPPFFVAGSLLLAFGWVYPHFLHPNSVFTYLYAAPIGLIPCPTLSAVSGLALMLGGLKSVVWPAVLGTLSLFYGIFGAAVLGVTIDWVLFAGAMCVLALSVHNARDRNARAA